ncbi:MAG: tetratricopeptide repeat protein [Acidobacteria bacterium]|nr:tetratricopeptide repeat protein [Acidobacteriota bacterium]
MAIDRAEILRNAEKLIRQGKLDAGIAEYVRLVEDQPHDWNAKNTLGDLYARAGQVDKAIEQFIEIANSLNEGGSIQKAGAIFKKILKLKPDHEHTLVQLADILGSQKLYADARAHLTTLVEIRRGRGDARGAAQAKIRLGSLDPEDYDGRMTAVSARLEIGDVGGAMSDLKEIAGELAQKGRHPDAIEALREAAKLNPDDEEIRETLLDVYISAGDLARARECATTVEQLRLVATALEAQGNPDEALDTLRQASSLDPGDTVLRVQLAREFMARGDIATASEYLTVETAGEDPELLMTVATIQLRGDHPDEGLAIVRRVFEADPSRQDQIARLGWAVAEHKPEAGFGVAQMVADAGVAKADWPAAAAVLQEFVTRVPNHIAALMRLVEICVDGGLEATMYSAQAQLADAYIAAGAATEARFIAEDLVAREPWDKANIERFRRSLELLGEPDPDALIAARLSGESPFISTELSPDIGDLTTPDEPPDAGPALPEPELVTVDPDLMTALDAAERPTSPAAQRRAANEGRQFALSANAIDLESILGGEPETPPATAHATSSDVEVDLSIVLDDAKKSAAPKPTAKAESVDLEGVFGSIRDKAAKRSGLDDAEKEYKRGLALRDAGDIDGCIQALEKASRAPKLRFGTARLIARLYRDRDNMAQAIAWLERATQAPAPTADDAHQVMYELADGLEKISEVARALAVCLELQADAGDYKDVAARIDRLSKVQAGG